MRVWQILTPVEDGGGKAGSGLKLLPCQSAHCFLCRPVAQKKKQVNYQKHVSFPYEQKVCVLIF